MDVQISHESRGYSRTGSKRRELTKSFREDGRHGTSANLGYSVSRFYLENLHSMAIGNARMDNRNTLTWSSD